MAEMFIATNKKGQFKGLDGIFYALPKGKSKPRSNNVLWSKLRDKLIHNAKVCKICNSNYWLLVDHIIPLRAGGTNEMSNLQVLCQGCNSIKGNTIDKELYKEFLYGNTPHVVQYNRWIKKNRPIIKKRRENI